MDGLGESALYEKPQGDYVVDALTQLPYPAALWNLACRNMAPRYRAALEAHYRDGKTQREIAEELGVSPQRASQILIKGVKKARASLRHLPPFEEHFTREAA